MIAWYSNLYTACGDYYRCRVRQGHNCLDMHPAGHVHYDANREHRKDSEPAKKNPDLVVCVREDDSGRLLQCTPGTAPVTKMPWAEPVGERGRLRSCPIRRTSIQATVGPAMWIHIGCERVAPA
jgi:hypothetical protein